MLNDINDEDITILLPTNANGDTEGDSGDECILDQNNLNRNQLMAEASGQQHKADGDVILGLDNNFDASVDSGMNHPSRPLSNNTSKESTKRIQTCVADMQLIICITS